MADAARQLAFTEETLALAHTFGIMLHLVEDVANTSHTANGILCHDVAQLLHAELHVVEVGNGITQRFRHADKHLLEVAEGHASQIAVLGVDGLEGLGTRDEHHHAPIAVLGVAIVALSIGSLDEAEHLAVNIFLTTSLQLLADVGCHHVDVMLQEVDIGKNSVVDALQHVVGCRAKGFHAIGIVDESVAQWAHVSHLAFQQEVRQDGVEI